MTDEDSDDFDPCFPPNVRIAFITERRGGHLRCNSEFYGSYENTLSQARGEIVYPTLN
jgi:hypothetical protein